MPRRRVALLVVVGALVAAATASAHLVNTYGWYHESRPFCVGGGSAIAEGPPQAMAESYTAAEYNGTCLTAKNMPSGYLHVRRQTYVYDGSWRICSDGGDKYNSSPTSYITSFKQWTGKRTPPCGSNWYDNLAHANAWSSRYGQWYGGTGWSGYHYF